MNRRSLLTRIAGLLGLGAVGKGVLETDADGITFGNLGEMECEPLGCILPGGEVYTYNNGSSIVLDEAPCMIFSVQDPPRWVPIRADLSRRGPVPYSGDGTFSTMCRDRSTDEGAPEGA